MKKYHSCYIIDVSADNQRAVLTDSTRCTWNVNLADQSVASQFKAWMRTIFLKGVAQTLTVFEYEDRSENDVDIENYITKFCVSGAAQTLNEGETV